MNLLICYSLATHVPSEGQFNRGSSSSRLNASVFLGEDYGNGCIWQTTKKECGQYFRANIWSWRPIHQQIGELCSDLLDEDLLVELGLNQGAGPDDQETCDEMANRFERALVTHQDGLQLESDIRVDESGRLLSEEDLKRNPELKTYSPYVTEREHVMEWIEFLRHCGGFAVW
jgi:hypothetical protein